MKKPIPSNNDYYADEDGHIYFLKNGEYREVKPFPHKAGAQHLQITLRYNGKRKNKFVHHLVLETFVGPKPECGLARHLNDDGGDNRLVNLCWGTYQENANDRVEWSDKANIFSASNIGRTKLLISKMGQAGFTSNDFAYLTGTSPHNFNV